MSDERPDEAARSVGTQQAAYYGHLLGTHGVGVDAVASGRREYKEVRYERLCRVIGDEAAFSIHDVGFGLGHLRDYLSRRFPDRSIRWSGSEVTSEFLEHLRSLDPMADISLRDLAVSPAPEQYDYVLLAGTFYHHAGATHDEFTAFVEALIRNCWSMCRMGLAFNVVTDHVDYRIDDLFYPSIGDVIGTVRSLTRFFEIDHATPLYEYTVRLFRPESISARFPHPAFDRYVADRRTGGEPAWLREVGPNYGQRV